MAKNIQRRLAAILAADVVGYSRLMGENVKASRDAGDDAHQSSRQHESVAVSGGALGKTTAYHRTDSESQCWN